MPSKGTKKSVWAANEMIGRVLLLAADIELWVEKPNIQDVALCGLSDYASTGDPCVIHASIQMMQQTQMNRALRLRCARLSDKGIQRSEQIIGKGRKNNGMQTHLTVGVHTGPHCLSHSRRQRTNPELGFMHGRRCRTNVIAESNDMPRLRIRNAITIAAERDTPYAKNRKDESSENY